MSGHMWKDTIHLSIHEVRKNSPAQLRELILARVCEKEPATRVSVNSSGTPTVERMVLGPITTSTGIEDMQGYERLPVGPNPHLPDMQAEAERHVRQRLTEGVLGSGAPSLLLDAIARFIGTVGYCLPTDEQVQRAVAIGRMWR